MPSKMIGSGLSAQRCLTGGTSTDHDRIILYETFAMLTTRQR
jgi:hypothetical protein